MPEFWSSPTAVKETVTYLKDEQDALTSDILAGAIKSWYLNETGFDTGLKQFN